MNRAAEELCAACGSANPAANRFCAQCGGVLSATAQNPYAVTYSPPSGSAAEVPVAAAVDPADSLTLYQQRLKLQAMARNGMGWFFLIGGISLVNTAIFAAGGNLHFIVGLGATQVINIVAQLLSDKTGNVAFRFVGFGLDVLLAGMFLVIGVLAHKGHRWIVVVGMLLYTLDGLIYVWLQQWLSVGFHAFALFGLFHGLKAMHKLHIQDETAIAQIEAGRRAFRN